jgi:hypothetical protein
MSELSGVKRETTRRAYQDNSQTQEEISRWLSTLERNIVCGETHHRVTEYSARRASS